eukprot:Nitzschia sp. Nitz4//scaffold141_size107518//96814//98427//NITZ4_004299-RA/size107518-processed-gene-0.143-mRNA-1//-1//CDS//3329536357//4800//frame0
MVLQREPQEARLWGWAAVGAVVTVALDSGRVVVRSDPAGKDGSWEVSLPPQPAGADHEIVLSDGNDDITLVDIAFGDVYLCSGQSNMVFTVCKAFDSDKEITDSINYPNLRLATAKLVVSDKEEVDVATKTYYQWARSSPSAVTGNMTEEDSLLGASFGVFSAVCYFFGRDTYKALGGEVPIGLVTSAWSGQPIEAFSSPAAMQDRTCGGLRPDVADTTTSSVATRDKRADSIPLDPAVVQKAHEIVWKASPSSIWNGMIHPFIPMRLSGVVWYQGEANEYDPKSYACRFPAMISDWRTKWEEPDLPFIFVQLAGFEDGHTWPWLRAAQAAALEVPNVGMATAMDLSDPTASPTYPVHPRRKQEVGRRLSLSMQQIRYEVPESSQDAIGPTLKGVQLESFNGNSGARLQWTIGDTDIGKLHFSGSADCNSCCKSNSFEALAPHGEWYPIARAYLSGEDEVIVETNNNTTILGIRYAWSPRPECILYNGLGGPDDHAGLPAVPWTWCAYPSGKGAWTEQPCVTYNSGKDRVEDDENSG